MKYYFPIVGRGAGGQVYVKDPDATNATVLNPRFDLVNHSPTGFAWGYYGSGPAQLALAILADASGEDDTALAFYQDFKREKIGALPPGEPWRIEAEEVRSWLRDRPDLDTRPRGAAS